MAGGDSPLTRAFGNVVRASRHELSLSQEKLALLSGLDRTFISKIERGWTSPSLRVLEKLARVLGQRPHRLIKAAEDELRRLRDR